MLYGYSLARSFLHSIQLASIFHSRIRINIFPPPAGRLLLSRIPNNRVSHQPFYSCPFVQPTISGLPRRLSNETAVNRCVRASPSEATLHARTGSSDNPLSMDVGAF